MRATLTLPHRSEPREDTGLYNAKLGMWLFLAAEAMFFGALFSSYVFLRTAAQEWPVGAEVLPLGLSALNTLVILAVAVSSAQAWAALRQDRCVSPSKWLWLTIAGGVASVLLIMAEHHQVAAAGNIAATHNFYALYYLLTGLQRFHVIAGLCVTLYLTLRGPRMRAQDHKLYANRVECTGLYWQFLAALWLVMILMFYVV